MKIFLLNFYRCFPLLLLYLLLDGKTKKKIELDLIENLKWVNYGGIKSIFGKLFYLMVTGKTFRSVFYFRTSKKKILTKICKLFFPSLQSIEIGCKEEIGGGLSIPHTTVVLYATRIGKNCHVCPGVVVGQVSGGKFPVIGDNVMIGANASVVGDVTIGNNVAIGAGSVVVKDVPDNCTVVGNPMRIIINKEA